MWHSLPHFKKTPQDKLWLALLYPAPVGSTGCPGTSHTPSGSAPTLTCCAVQVNEAFREAANGKSKGILAISDLPLVSCDFKKTDVSTTIDASLTMVMGDDMVKVVAW